MKQLLQNLGTGETLLADTACPCISGSSLLIESSVSLVSLGTEKMLMDFGKANLLEKARQQPDKVKQVLQKIRTDGLFPTLEAVRAKLDQPIPLGYSNVGFVLKAESRTLKAETGDVKPEIVSIRPDTGELKPVLGNRFSPGDRVVSNGPHAEMVAIPKNLCARIPDSVSDEEAAFTVVGAIGLQGVRLIQPTLGEFIVVSGLGLIGLMTVQILRAHSCRVLGIDFDARKLELARQFGAQTVNLSAGEDPIAAADTWSAGQGVDGVIITASSRGDEVVHQAATMCRKRGRIVLVGVVGLNLRRDDFYKKELTFQVSCSYGPGRYDEAYEKQGYDYPPAFVRWTEQRNFEAVLGLMADGKLDVKPLITHRFAFSDALKAYETIGQGGALGVLLDYGKPSADARKLEKTVRLNPSATAIEGSGGRPVVAFIGAGNFTTRMLLPVLSKLDVRRKMIVSSTGVSGSYAGRKFGFELASTEVTSVFEDPEINAVFITTPHNTHARLVTQALRAGKNVFVEKPLCLTLGELEEIKALLTTKADTEKLKPGSAERNEKNPAFNFQFSALPLLMVGFNRRFSPHTVHIRKCLQGVPGPKAIVITVNAGAIPTEHWTQNPKVGGGRIIGEGCHFIDLARFLAGAPIVSTTASYLGGHEGRLGDCTFLQIGFEDGSIATIHYLANGHKGFPKERVEVFAGGKVLQCDNFRRTKGFGFMRGHRTWSQDKGHAAGVKAFIDAVQEGGAWPIPAAELVEVSEATIKMANLAVR